MDHLMFRSMAFAGLLAAQMVVPGSGSASEPLGVALNMARVLRLATPVATVIVGNPGIADVTVEDATTLVLTGKSFGTTNLIALDAAGNALADTLVVVSEPSGYVTVFAGLKKGTMHCTPSCQPVVMVGDDAEYTKAAKSSADLLAASALAR